MRLKSRKKSLSPVEKAVDAQQRQQQRGQQQRGQESQGDQWLPPGRGLPGVPNTLLGSLLDKAIDVPSATIRKHVESLRRKNPMSPPAHLVYLLEKEYLRAVTAAGGAVGTAAAIPAVGTGTAAALTAVDFGGFFAASAAFALAVAEVHGIESDDIERRRALLLASLLGPGSGKDVEAMVYGTGAVPASAAAPGIAGTIAWGKVLMTTLPKGTVKQVNKALASSFVKKQLAKQGGVAVGRVLPFGVGAVIGFAGAHALGRGVVIQCRHAFGPAAPQWGSPYPGLPAVADPDEVVEAEVVAQLPASRVGQAG
ncbi:MAG: hypothetical protein LBB54_02295 [Cellulomonadaceae bacterium]|jgi:hypothetical protein|nr:hypothetical protein [Cellulomonadaceae bacterium]